MPFKVNSKELVRRLQTLGKVGQRKTIRSAGRAGARVWLKIAVDKVPVRTGQLKQSLKLRQSVRKGLGLFSVGTDKTGHHAHLVEFGTKAHDIPLPRGNKYMPPGSTIKHPGAALQPFLRPAYYLGKEESLRRVVKNLKKNIIKYTGRG